MKQQLEPLFTPWKIGNCEIKNRIVLTSMGGTNLLGWMEVNHFDKDGAKFILEVAKNNCGLVLPGCQPVYNPMYGQWLYKKKKMYEDLAKWMPEFHKTGAKLFVQLTAGFGRSFTISEMMETLYTNKALRVLAKPFMDLDKITAAPSPSPNRWSDKVPSREMTVEEIQEFITAFGKTAKLLKDAGYDMLNCDNGTYDAWYWAHPPIYMPENCNLEDVAHIRKFVDIPVVCAGRMDPETAAAAIADGKIDGAGFARQFLADQEWVTKLMNDREDDIRPCILCHNGCFNMCHYKGVPNDQALSDSLHLARCAVNAETMQWEKHKIVPTTSPKKVHIIGGGIGGMEAARVLKLRGHEPVIHEQTDHLGGTFIAASAESYKGKLRDLLTWYRKQMVDLKIEIHYNEKVESIAPFAGAPVIIATGAVPRVLKKVPGHEKMVEACEYLTGTLVGEKVAVIGGGLTGCEIAYELALQGKQPVIVEMKNDLIAQTGVCLANSSYLREWFAWKKVPVYLETTLQEVKDDSIVCKDASGKEITIPCDSVISSAGYIPNPLAPKGSNVSLVGDCDGVGNLRSVVWRAYEVAMKI